AGGGEVASVYFSGKGTRTYAKLVHPSPLQRPPGGESRMITMLGSPRRCCDGLTRRETLKAGALSVLGGLSLPDLLRAEAARKPGQPHGKAKSVICLFLLGGAATQDMFDLKPGAPADIRGEFKPISTNVPGIQICEHLPLTAQWM